MFQYLHRFAAYFQQVGVFCEILVFICILLNLLWCLGRHGVQRQECDTFWGSCGLLHWTNSVGGAWNQRTTCFLSTHSPRCIDLEVIDRSSRMWNYFGWDSVYQLLDIPCLVCMTLYMKETKRLILPFWSFYKWKIYFFLLYIGTKVIPCDFIAPVESQNPISNGVHHEVCDISSTWYHCTFCAVIFYIDSSCKLPCSNWGVDAWQDSWWGKKGTGCFWSHRRDSRSHPSPQGNLVCI